MTTPPPGYPQPGQQPYGAPQQPYGPPPVPPRKRKIWPWVLLGMVVLLFGGCLAVVGTAGKEVAEAVDAAATSIQQAAETPGATPGGVPPLVPKVSTGNGKTIVYEVISDSEGLNSITYFDENSEIQQVPNPTAPWTMTVTNKSTVAIAGLGAQTEGTSVTCRIIVDGKVADEKTSTGKYAVVNCTA